MLIVRLICLLFGIYAWYQVCNGISTGTIVMNIKRGSTVARIDSPAVFWFFVVLHAFIGSFFLAGAYGLTIFAA
jgi:hypothetical protein